MEGKKIAYFQHYQLQFTAHIRDPKTHAKPAKVTRAPGLHLGSDVTADLLYEVCQQHHAEILIASGAHGNGPICLLLVANDQDEWDLLH